MTALPQSGAFTMVDPTHVAEVGPAAALLYARILWRANQNGGKWRATRRELADETGLTEATLRTACRVLREQQWVAADRTSADDSTLVWRPLCPSDQQMDDQPPPPAESAPPPSGIRQTPPAESSIPSLETGRDNYLDTHAADSGVHQPADLEPLMPEPADAPALFAVPDVPADDGPPKTAQTLVARWCDGYRDRNGGNAPKAFMGRVAGQARNLAKACGDEHEEWVQAYHAAYAAGQQGQADITRFLVNSSRPSSARRNVFADPTLGGPGADTMTRFQQMFRPGQTPPPLALGGPQ